MFNFTLQTGRAQVLFNRMAAPNTFMISQTYYVVRLWISLILIVPNQADI